jgi:hypothetical protein
MQEVVVVVEHMDPFHQIRRFSVAVVEVDQETVGKEAYMEVVEEESS